MKELEKRYSFVLTPEYWGGFSGKVLQFPGCFSEGETITEAARNLYSAAESWVLACKNNNTPIPEPDSTLRYNPYAAPGLIKEYKKLLKELCVLRKEEEPNDLPDEVEDAFLDQLEEKARVSLPKFDEKAKI